MIPIIETPRQLRRFLLLGLVDVGASFPQVEVHFVPGVAALQLQQSSVLALVPQAALVAGEDGLTPQSGKEHTTVRQLAQHQQSQHPLLPPPRIV